MRDYTEQIRQFWPTIMQAWEAHADKRPMIECDLVSSKVRAYASDEYIESLSARTREPTRLEFARTMDEGGSSRTAETMFSSRTVSSASVRHQRGSPTKSRNVLLTRGGFANVEDWR